MTEQAHLQRANWPDKIRVCHAEHLRDLHLEVKLGNKHNYKGYRKTYSGNSPLFLHHSSKCLRTRPVKTYLGSVKSRANDVSRMKQPICPVSGNKPHDLEIRVCGCRFLFDFIVALAVCL